MGAARPGVPVLRDGHDRGSAAGRARGLGVVRAGAERGGGAADLLRERTGCACRASGLPVVSPRAVARCARCGQDRPPQARSAHYARLSDRTVREHWGKARKVNAEGQPVQVSPGGPLGDAAWSKHHLSRATQALPNGYCQLQLVKTCPHANSCFLTCPMFVTTAEFLPQHRAQRAEVGGDLPVHLRDAGMSIRLSGGDDLQRGLKIITALEADGQDEENEAAAGAS